MGPKHIARCGQARRHRGNLPLAVLIALVVGLNPIGIDRAPAQVSSQDTQLPESIKIVGIGTSSCSIFLREIADAPAAERDYIAWAQGFMSGALVRAPSGQDTGLDLLPPQFPLVRQAEFLRRYCEANSSGSFSDAVIELYRLLRMPPS